MKCSKTRFQRFILALAFILLCMIFYLIINARLATFNPVPVKKSVSLDTDVEGKVSRMRSQCLQGVTFVSNDIFLAENSQIIEFSNIDDANCQISVGKSECDICVDFANESVNASRLGISDSLLPIPETLNGHRLPPIFPLIKPVTISIYEPSEHNQNPPCQDDNVRKPMTFQVISSEIGCNQGELLNAVIDCLQQGSVPVVLKCDAKANIPFSWALDWEKAVLFVQPDALHVRKT